jgi:hypothetical protein
MPVHVEFTTTFEDYLSAQRLHATRNAWSRFNDFAARRLNPALGVLILIFAVLLSVPKINWSSSLILMVPCGLILLFYPIYMRNRLKRCYVRTRLGNGLRTIDFDLNSIKAVEENVKSEIEWAAIQSVREDKNVIMLYLAPAKFMMIPTRVCSDEQRNELRQIFPENLPIESR